MNTTLADAHTLALGVRDGVEHLDHIQVVLCPPTIWLTELAHEAIAPGRMPHLHLGAQNLYFEEKGAFTGETSPLMVKEVAEYTIVGHSERTHVFGETAELCNKKVKAAFAAGITPILCIGEDVQSETSKEELGKVLEVMIEGLTEDQLKQLVVAYEPVWAIGSGTPATPEYAQEICEHLRQWLTSDTHILYGGSANEENAKAFLQQSDVDGLLIGGVSLKLQPFLSVCTQANDLHISSY